MMATEQIQIPLSKRKLVLSFTGSLVFEIIGLWFVISPPTIQNAIFGNKTILMIIGLVTIIFFGYLTSIFFKKLKDTKPGLTIDDKGITDNASGISAGFIPWTDITEFKITQVMNQKFIMILVSNPDTYINKQSSLLIRKTAEINYANYGSPISISANTLKCNFEELKNILETAFNKYK